MMMVYLVPKDKFETAFAGLGAYCVYLHFLGSEQLFYALRRPVA